MSEKQRIAALNRGPEWKKKVHAAWTDEKKASHAAVFAGKKRPEVGPAISAAKKGKPNGLLGKKKSPEARRNMSVAAKSRGNNHNWATDGKSNERKTEREIAKGGVEYRLWREAVFARDDWTCQECGVRGGVYLISDHIFPWKTHPHLRYDVGNGRTLCDPCHRRTPTFGTRLLHALAKTDREASP